VATLNLRGVHDRWWRREPLVVRDLARLRPEVICLQEAATWCLQARWLAWRITRASGLHYRVRQARKGGWEGLAEGIATLSRLPLERPERLDLGGNRVAVRVDVRAGEGRLAVINTHLEHRNEASETRRLQLDRLGRWGETPGPQIIVGDLNDVPGSPALAGVQAKFRPAHSAKPGLLGTWPSRDPRKVIDYILVGEGVEVLEAGEFADRPAGGVWPSDHLGLWAKLRF
jgi:endonuclease/exonuclease/phosphatase family metal-dependent hydrolase